MIHDANGGFAKQVYCLSTRLAHLREAIPMFKRKVSHGLKILSSYVEAFGVVRGIGRCVYDFSRWIIFSKGKVFSVTAPSGESLFLRARSSDFLVYDEVILRKCYALDEYPQRASLYARYNSILDNGKIPLIIDAGANIGFAAVVFRKEFPKSVIVSIEPAKQNVEVARLNLGSAKGIKILNNCLWHREGSLVLENASAEAFSFRYEESASADQLSIPSVVIDALCNGEDRTQLFILKIDIEGAENEVLSAPGDWWSENPILMIEPHDWLGVGRKSLAGVLRRPAYQNGDVILKDSVVIFIPSSVD